MNRLIIIYLLLLPYFLDAQTATWEHYRNQLEINDVLIHQNKLWIATDDGLYSMDRNNLQVEHFTTQNSNLPDNHLQTLAKDAQGDLWIGTYDLALVQIPNNGGSWNIINYPSNPSFTNVYCSKIAPNGDIWMGTNNGLMHHNGNTWQIYPMASANAPVWDMEITSTGKIFIGSFNLQSFENGVWTELHDSSQSHNFLTYNDHDLYLENDSTLWLLPLGTNQILRYQNNNWLSWSTQNGDLPIAPRFEKAKLKLNQAGQLSYTTNTQELIYYDGNNWLIDSSIQYQQTNFYGFQNFLKDSNGDLWAFDNNKIIHKTPNTTLTHEFSQLEAFDNYQKLVPDNSGNMFLLSAYSALPSKKIVNGIWSDFTIPRPNDTLTTFTGGAFDNNNYLWATTRLGTAGNYTTSILQQTATGWIEHNHSTTGGQLPQLIQQGNYYGQFGNIVISTAGTVWVQYGPNYIFEYKNGNWSVVYAAPTNVYIHQLQTDSLNNLWWIEKTTNYQLKKYDGTNVHSFSMPTPLSNSGLYPVHVTANGEVWVAPASLNTLEKFDGTNWSTIALPANNTYPRAIKSQHGKLYVATSFAGIFDYDGTNWNNTTVQNSGLTIDQIKNVVFDNEGNLWIQDYYGKLLNVWKLGNSITTSTKNIEQSQKLEVSIYPNPTVNSLNITHPKEMVTAIKILDAKGQVLKTIQPTLGTTTTVSVEQLAAGVYWLQLNSATQQYIQPFVKH